MMRGLRRVRRFLGLSGADRRRLARAWLALAVMDARLRARGYRRVIARIERRRTLRPASPADVARARGAARWLAIAARHHVVGAHCLHRALALHAALRHAGLESVLRIGVRKEDGVLRAHAWVELGGEVVTDTAEAVAPFAPLAPANPLAMPVAEPRQAGHAAVWSGSR